MFKIFTVLALTFSTAAFADIEPTKNEVDYGVVVGALASKVFKVKAGNYQYAVVAADFDEPACNPVQAVVNVIDDSLEGEGSATYNLGLNFSKVVSAKANGSKVVLNVVRNDTGDCTKGIHETYTLEYPGKAGPLSFKKK